METIHERENKFYMGANEEEPIGQLTYHIEEDKLIIEHVYVTKALRARGIGIKLVEKAVAIAREKELILIPHCSYAEKVLLEDEAYGDVYKKEE